MSQSLSKVYVHITFCTNYRQLLIDDIIEVSLFNTWEEYATGWNVIRLKWAGIGIMFMYFVCCQEKFRR